MPLADFLATAGRGTVIGNVAQAFGGRTPGQSAIDDFIDNQLPVIEQNVRKATSRDEINNALRPLIFGGMKVGYPQKDIENLAGMLAGPALEGLQANEIAKIRADYGPQTTPLTPQVAPEGQGQPLGLDTVFQPQTTPARPLDVEGAARYFEATGAKPQSFESIFRTPSVIAENEAQAGAANAAKSYHMSQQAVEDIQRRALEGLPQTDIPGTGMTTRSLGQATKGGGLSSLVREQDPLVPERRGLLIEQTAEAKARADRARRPAAAPTGGGTTSPAMRDFIAIGGDPTNEQQFLEFLRKRAEAGRKPSDVEEYLKKRGGGTAPAQPGQKRSLEDIFGTSRK